MRKLFCLPYIFCLFSILPADNIDEYIQSGLENNLALKQKKFNYQKSMHALREARGLFFPSISIEARYTRAGGGREIEFPVGTLLNPVYSTLNQLTGSQNFPQLDNEFIPFLRKREHDTKLRVVQPVFQYALYNNYNIKDELEKSSQEEVTQYKQLLIKEISSAYYRFIQASKIKDLYQGALELVEENVRVSQVLFNNDIVTQDAVYRSKAELLKTEQQLVSAVRDYSLSKAYFNFLLNRDLETDISVDKTSDLPIVSHDLQTAEAQALNQRNEIRQLTHALNASYSAVNLASANYYPGISFVLDYGFQGSEYAFDTDHDYWMASAILSWNIFNGFQDSEKIQQAKMNFKILQSQLLELKQKIRMQVKDAFHSLETTRMNYKSAREQENYSSESFKIISKKFEQGLASQMELIDARVTMTNSKINTVVNYYSYLISYAEFLQLTGALTMDKSEE